jgi:hypothetical protein
VVGDRHRVALEGVFAQALAQLEKPQLMRQFGLILENLDGLEDPTNKFVMRSVPPARAAGRARSYRFRRLPVREPVKGGGQQDEMTRSASKVGTSSCTDPAVRGSFSRLSPPAEVAVDNARDPRSLPGGTIRPAGGAPPCPGLLTASRTLCPHEPLPLAIVCPHVSADVDRNDCTLWRFRGSENPPEDAGFKPV